ncbi:molybdopterin-guanine dinucleotide biosynthesis protein A [Devosia enhydra]|uniref:Molybdopterin-guanine dinucleotide biosynthesis protein A n=1 Tax=Devosia enhydra TaxID=665118 RepID=A0A1K2HV32_9HYPH|nr:molybdenum cofactor guanylyltransferase [Devosia enhydra]SFZ82448.1 molybdopterin-guanine dinucleotide biosynthesis protein A [Devosia enhydra]
MADAAAKTVTIATVILAGGKGTRLGTVDKAQLRLWGETLRDHVLARLPGDGPILIAIGSGRSDRPLPDGVVAIADGAGDSGPLAGVLSAARWLASRRPDCTLLHSVPVDSPFLPLNLAATLERALPPHCAAIFPRCHAQVAWAHGLWRIEALLAAGKSLEPPLPGPRGLAAGVNTAVLDWPADGDEDPFAGINTLAELLAATRKFARANNPQEVKSGLGKADQTG